LDSINRLFVFRINFNKGGAFMKRLVTAIVAASFLMFGFVGVQAQDQTSSSSTSTKTTTSDETKQPAKKTHKHKAKHHKAKKTTETTTETTTK
jgi:Ni/Co efflux regulator RcnB